MRNIQIKGRGKTPFQVDPTYLKDAWLDLYLDPFRMQWSLQFHLSILKSVNGYRVFLKRWSWWTETCYLLTCAKLCDFATQRRQERREKGRKVTSLWQATEKANDAIVLAQDMGAEAAIILHDGNAIFLKFCFVWHRSIQISIDSWFLEILGWFASHPPTLCLFQSENCGLHTTLNALPCIYISCLHPTVSIAFGVVVVQCLLLENVSVNTFSQHFLSPLAGEL